MPTPPKPFTATFTGAADSAPDSASGRTASTVTPHAVAEPADCVKAMGPSWALIEALLGGTQAMREAGETYLPRWVQEEADTYDKRLQSSTLFPAFSRTVTTLVGKPFAKPITYGENVPTRLKSWLEEDADLQGRNLDAFAASVMQTALAYGLAGILVDYPTVAPGTLRSVAEERAAGVRPYFVEVLPTNILGWRSEMRGGVEVLTQLRLREYRTEPLGAFGERTVEQIRVLEPGSFSIWRQKKNAQGLLEWVMVEAGTMAVGVIPFVPVYGERAGFMRGRPPLMEMAHLNVKHWQSQSDQDNLLHVARVPILFVAGIDDDRFTLTVGGSSAVKLPAGATMGFVEHDNRALGAGKVSLDDLKEEMRQAGAELLVLRPGLVTATEVASDNAVSMSALNRAVAGLEDALDQALQLAARWAGEAQGGNVSVYNDFGAATLAEASAQLLVGMRQSGDLSRATLLTEIKRRGILSADVDVEVELAAADADGPPGGLVNAEPEPDPAPGQGAVKPEAGA
jgi:hypothetical protein